MTLHGLEVAEETVEYVFDLAVAWHWVKIGGQQFAELVSLPLLQ